MRAFDMLSSFVVETTLVTKAFNKMAIPYIKSLHISCSVDKNKKANW